MDALRDLVTARSFALGVLWGALVVLCSPPLARLARRRVTNMGGLAFGLAAFLALRGWGGAAVAPYGVAFALVLLTIGGAAIDHLELRLPTRVPRAAIAPAIALLPGAIVLGVFAPIHNAAWAPYTIALVTPLVGGLMHDFDRVHSARPAPLLLLFISIVGAYLTVPQTALVLVLVGVSVPLALLSFPQPLAALGPAGSALVAGVFCWVVVAAGHESPGSVVGALGALGLLVIEPLGRRFQKVFTTHAMRRSMRRRPRELAARYGERWIVVVSTAAVCQLLFMLYAARIAGLEHTAFMALLSLTPAFVVGMFAVAEIVPSKEPRTHGRSSHRHSRSPSSHGRHAW